MQTGLFIVIEGIDGTGKSTQARNLTTWLNTINQPTVISREPTDGPWGKRLRQSATLERLNPEEEMRFFILDRKQHVNELIQPNIAAGRNVVLDRYYFSTMAYQSQRGFDPIKIRQENEAFAPIPDLLLILDLDVDKALDRIGARGDTANEFEKRDSLQACRNIYISVSQEPFAVVIPSYGTTEEVFERIQEAVIIAFKKHKKLQITD